MKKIAAFAFVGLLSLGGMAQAADTRPDSVYAAIKANKDLSEFASMISEAGLEKTLSDPAAKVTVFAPSNKAMDKISSDVMKKVKSDKANYKSLVLHHTIMGSVVMSANIRNRRASPSTGNGDMIGFDGMGTDLKVEQAKIVTPDLGAKNGVVHVVDAALVPLSLDDATAQKVKDAEEADRKKQEEEMKKREAKMEEERAKMEAQRAKENPPAAKAATAPAAPTVQEPTAPTTPTVAAPADTSATTTTKTEEKSSWKKLFGF